MEGSVFLIVEQINQLHKKAYDIYLPLVDDVCRRKALEEELSYLFDYLLDLACDESMLGLYKRCAESICIFIQAALSFILMHIGRYGKMKILAWQNTSQKVINPKVRDIIIIVILRRKNGENNQGYNSYKWNRYWNLYTGF